MHATLLRLTLFGAILLTLATGCWWQWRQTVTLRAALAYAQAERHEKAQLQAERDRLARLQISPAELERLRADRAALPRLRHELDVLRQVGERRTPPARPRATGGVDGARPAPSVTEGTVVDALLKNVGHSTPAAAVETALWAATSGEVEALEQTFLIEGDARTAAEEMFAGLPPSVRQQYGTPERMLALLTARDVPLGSMHILAPRKVDPAGTRVVTQLRDPEGKLRAVALVVRETGDGWKIVVPPSAITKYQGTASSAALAGR